jgi:hypothetical protein
MDQERCPRLLPRSPLAEAPSRDQAAPVLLHPGWLRTRQPRGSVRGMPSLVDRHEPNLSAGLFRSDGARMPW